MMERPSGVGGWESCRASKLPTAESKELTSAYADAAGKLPADVDSSSNSCKKEVQ